MCKFTAKELRLRRWDFDSLEAVATIEIFEVVLHEFHNCDGHIGSHIPHLQEPVPASTLDDFLDREPF